MVVSKTNERMRAGSSPCERMRAGTSPWLRNQNRERHCELENGPSKIYHWMNLAWYIAWTIYIYIIMLIIYKLVHHNLLIIMMIFQRKSLQWLSGGYDPRRKGYTHGKPLDLVDTRAFKIAKTFDSASSQSHIFERVVEWSPCAWNMAETSLPRVWIWIPKIRWCRSRRVLNSHLISLSFHSFVWE